MKVKEEEISDSEYSPQEDEEDQDDLPSLRCRRKIPPFSPSVEQRTPLETKKKVFDPRRSPLRPTHMAKIRVRGDLQNPGGKRKRSADEYNHLENSSVRNQVKEIQEILGVECPVFVKSMIHSNVFSSYCLTLPKQFCLLHLPLHDTRITLELESGEKYRTSYLADKRLLSAGWKKFSDVNKLLVGDLLVFSLVRPLKFKVYIMGKHSQAEVNAAFSLLRMSASTERKVFDYAEQLHPVPLQRDVFHGNIQKTSQAFDTKPELLDDYLEYNNEELDSNDFLGSERIRSRDQKYRL